MLHNESLLFRCIVPGPCEPEDLIDGIIFAANYLGCTPVSSDKNPSKSVRMSQAHEAVSHIKVIFFFQFDSVWTIFKSAKDAAAPCLPVCVSQECNDTPSRRMALCREELIRSGVAIWDFQPFEKLPSERLRPHSKCAFAGLTIPSWLETTMLMCTCWCLGSQSGFNYGFKWSSHTRIRVLPSDWCKKRQQAHFSTTRWSRCIPFVLPCTG